VASALATKARPTIDYATADARAIFVHHLATAALARALKDLREPRRCPRCPSTAGSFTYDEETHTWICHACAATWSASDDEGRR
jgi:transposase-like protein